MLTTFFREEHEIFRKTLRDFVSKELAPYTTAWEEAEEFPREVFKRCGELGFLAPTLLLVATTMWLSAAPGARATETTEFRIGYLRLDEKKLALSVLDVSAALAMLAIEPAQGIAVEIGRVELPAHRHDRGVVVLLLVPARRDLQVDEAHSTG